METKTVNCYSCGKPRLEDELGVCPICGARTCGIDDCAGTCLCDHLTRLNSQLAALQKEQWVKPEDLKPALS